MPQPEQNSRAQRAPCLARARLATALGAAAGVLLLAPQAYAGTYEIADCPAAGSSDSGPWSVFGGTASAKIDCGGAGGDYVGPRGPTMAPGSTAGARVSVPDGSAITIREALVWWYVPSHASGASTFALAGNGAGVLGESATPHDARQLPDRLTLPSGSPSLTLENYCANDDAGQGCTLGTGPAADLELHGARLTLAESRLPEGSVKGGGLSGPGPVSGTQSIGYDAADSDSGVRRVALIIDGHTVAEHDYLAVCAYSSFAACPQQESGTLSWNTASVPDGNHTLTVTVEDAAQNARTVLTASITTVNATAAAAPAAGLALPGSSSLGAALDPGETNGVGASTGARITLDGPAALTRAFARRGLALHGKLTGPDGHPIAGSTLEVLEQTTGAAAPSLISRPRTGADGGFSVIVAGGGTRRVTVAYRAYSGLSGYTAQANIVETVDAGVTLRVTPHASTPGGRIRLAGSVAGAIPPGGVFVELLVHYRGSWQPFRTPRTDATGRFQVTYQFQGAVGRFPFRAVVPSGQAGFPYGHGQSSTVAVTTR